MTTFDEERVREYYATWSAGDPDKVIEFFANEAVFEDLAFDAKFEGLDAIRSFAVLTYNPGLPATGKTFEVRASSIIQTQGSQILHITDYWNLVSLSEGRRLDIVTSIQTRTEREGSTNVYLR